MNCHKIFSLFLSTVYLLSNIQFANAVIGGEEVMPGQYPFMVYIPLCGGSLITEDKVLTAASCLVDTGNPGANGPIWLGRHGTANGTEVDITALHIHPTLDIAILEISPVADLLEYETVTLDGGDRFNHLDEVSRVIGWGFEFHEPSTDLEGYSYELLYIDVPVIEDDVCEPMLFGEGGSFGEGEFCAGAVGKDCCSGDEGGPMFHALETTNSIQHALISWHLGVCGDPYGVYLNLADAEDWIKTTAPNAEWTDCDNVEEIPVLLDEPFSFMEDEVVTMRIAVPRDTDWFEAVLDTPGYQVRGVVCDLDSRDVEASGCWSRINAEDIGAEGMYPDSCWWLFSITVSVQDLYDNGALVYEMSEEGPGFYSHVAITTHNSQTDPIADIRGIDVPDKSITTSHKYGILFPERVTVTGDIRVYDDVNLYWGFFDQSHWDSHWDWGFLNEMRKFDATVGVFTSVQWPFKFTNPQLVSNLAHSPVEIELFTECDDPGIGEVEDEAYNGAVVPPNGLPPPCEQQWYINIHPNGNYNGEGDMDCTLAGHYMLNFDVECFDSYDDHCPLDERFTEGIAQFEFDLTSENFCEWMDYGYHVTSQMSAHTDATRDPESEQYDFIVDFRNKDEELKPRYIYFQVRLYSEDTIIIAAELHNIWLTATDGKRYQLMTEGLDTSPPDMDFVSMNYAIPDEAYAPADRFSTCNFEFCMPYHRFPVRHRDSELIQVQATVDVWISDAPRNDKTPQFTRPIPDLLEKDGYKKVSQTIDLLADLKALMQPENTVEITLYGGEKDLGDALPQPDIIREFPDPPLDNQIDNTITETQPKPEEKSNTNSKSVLLVVFVTLCVCLW